jgi:hypothetical protein
MMMMMNIGLFFAWTKELRHQSLNVVFPVNFYFGWGSNFVGFESQKQSVKLLQNMVYNTSQHSPTCIGYYFIQRSLESGYTMHYMYNDHLFTYLYQQYRTN